MCTSSFEILDLYPFEEVTDSINAARQFHYVEVEMHSERFH